MEKTWAGVTSAVGSLRLRGFIWKLKAFNSKLLKSAARGLKVFLLFVFQGIYHSKTKT